MARISGTELNDKSRLIWALTRIKGVGWITSSKIVKKLGIDESKRVGDLKQKEIGEITTALEGYKTEGDLVRTIRLNMTRLKTIGSYRGGRNQRGLPSRGQRTKSNARTKRGRKRQTVGSFKKEVLTKMTSDTPKKE